MYVSGKEFRGRLVAHKNDGFRLDMTLNCKKKDERGPIVLVLDPEAIGICDTTDVRKTLWGRSNQHLRTSYRDMETFNSGSTWVKIRIYKYKSSGLLDVLGWVADQPEVKEADCNVM